MTRSWGEWLRFAGVALLIAMLIPTALAEEPAEAQGLTAEQLAAIAKEVRGILGNDPRILTAEEFTAIAREGSAIYERTGAGGVSAASFMTVIYVFAGMVAVLLAAWILANKRAQDQASKRFEASEDRHAGLLSHLQERHDRQDELDRELIRQVTETVGDMAVALRNLAHAIKDSPQGDEPARGSDDGGGLSSYREGTDGLHIQPPPGFREEGGGT